MITTDIDDLIKYLNHDIDSLENEIKNEKESLQISNSPFSCTSDIDFNQTKEEIEYKENIIQQYNLDLERINKGITSDINGFLREFKTVKDDFSKSMNSLLNNGIKDMLYNNGIKQQQQQQNNILKESQNSPSHNSGADIDIVHAFLEWRILIDEEVEELYILIKKLKKSSKLFNSINNNEKEAPSSPILNTRIKHPELYMHNSTFTNILQLKNDLIGIIKQFEKNSKYINSIETNNSNNINSNYNSEDSEVGTVRLETTDYHRVKSNGSSIGLLSKANSHPDVSPFIPPTMKVPPVLLLSSTAASSTQTASASKSAPSSPRQRSVSSSPSTSSPSSPSSSRKNTSSFMQSTQSSNNKSSTPSSKSNTNISSSNTNHSSLSSNTSIPTTSSPSNTLQTPSKSTTRGRANSTSTPSSTGNSIVSPLSSPIKKSSPYLKSNDQTQIGSNSTTPPTLKQSTGLRKPQMTIKQMNRSQQEQEEDVKLWIQKVIDCPLEELSHHPYSEPLLNHLQSGVVLCKLISSLDSAFQNIKISNIPRPFFQCGNIELFLQACVSLGVDKRDLFFSFDLHNIKENAIKPVLSTIYSLARATNHLDELRNISL